jgi:hypothetical protein
MAALDISFTLLGVLLGRPPSGTGVCQAVGFLDTFLASDPALGMAALSADQLLAVDFPLRYARAPATLRLRLLLAYTWGHSLAFALTALAGSWMGYSSTFSSCSLRP